MVGRKQFEPTEALDAAVRAFWEKSYAGTSIQDLVEATGLSRASLYSTFGGKEELFLACLHRYVSQVGEASRAALATPADDVRIPVAAGFDATLARLADPRQPAGCLLAQTAAESGSLGQPVVDAVRQILDDQVQHLTGVLAPHVPPGGDARTLAHYLVTTAQAIAVMHRAGADIEDLRATAAQAVRALDALSPR